MAELLVPLPNTLVCAFNMAENDMPFDELDPRAGGSVGLTILEVGDACTCVCVQI